MYTYLVKSQNLDETQVNNIMNKRKIWRQFNKDTDTNPDFIYADTVNKYDKTLESYQTKLKSIVDVISDNQSISNKYNLYRNMKHTINPINKGLLLNKEYVNLYKIYNKKYNLDKYQKMFIKHDVLIFKPIYGMGGGKGIKIFDNFQQFKKFCLKIIQKNKQQYHKLDYKEYQKLGGKKKFNYEIEWVLEEYIHNPLLVNDKKFHLRCFFIYHRVNKTLNTDKNSKQNNDKKQLKKKRGFLFHKAGLFSAKKNYEAGKYFDSDIHDSHYIKDGELINFPHDFINLFGKKMTDTMLQQVIEIHKEIYKVIDAPCYPESQSCFHIFGSDIMFNRNFEAKLIEVNDKPGYPDLEYYPINIFKSIMNNVVDYQFKPKMNSKSKTKTSKTKSNKSTKTSKTKTNKSHKNINDEYNNDYDLGKLVKETKTKKKTTRSMNRKSSKNTYLIKTIPITLSQKDIKDTFDKRGNWEAYIEDDENKQHPDYLHIDHSFTTDASLWKYKPKVQNKVDETKRSITRKDNIYQNLNKIPNANKFLLEQHTIILKDIMTNKDQLDNYKDLFNDNVWVVKIIGGWGGRDIYFFETYDEFKGHFDEIMKNNKQQIMKLEDNKKLNFINNYVKNEWIIQKYVSNPSLFKGKKYHLRVYFMYHKDNNVKKGYIYNMANILTAKDKYKKGDYVNNNIHDTRRGSTDKAYFFPTDFEKQFNKTKTKSVFNQLKELFGYVSQCIDSKCFEGTKHCYELFGADIMVDDDMNIKLLEINSSQGYPFFIDDTSNYIQEIFESSISTVVDKYMPPNKGKYINNFVEVYSE